jgi:ADP-ribose pyrophosphatase YjhB (NUDIX family)
VENALREFRLYKKKVPVAGLIAVAWSGGKGWGDGTPYTLLILPRVGRRAASAWAWPKGKRNEGEAAADCARREAEEEIGLRTTPDQVTRDRCIVVRSEGKEVALFIVPNVPLDAPLRAAEHEVAEMKWFPILELPPLVRSVAPAADALVRWARAQMTAAAAGAADPLRALQTRLTAST